MMKNWFIEPLYNGDCVPIVFSCDARYAIFVGVVIQNIIQKASPLRNYDIIILELGLDKNIKQEITDLTANHPNISVRFFTISEFVAQFNLDTIRIIKRFTKEVFFPVFVPFLCRNYPKVIYLDPDILLERDIATLYDTELKDAWLGAVIDFECAHDMLTGDEERLRYRQYIIDSLGVNLSEFCNSGVLLFNNEQIWKENAAEAFFNAFNAVRWLPDQDILNYVCRGRIHFLDPRWNVQSFAYARYVFKNLTPEQAALFNGYLQDAWVIHYTYLVKPWFHAGCRSWWHIAKSTVFFERICRDFLFNDVDNGMLLLKKDIQALSNKKNTPAQ